MSQRLVSDWVRGVLDIGDFKIIYALILYNVLKMTNQSTTFYIRKTCRKKNDISHSQLDCIVIVGYKHLHDGIVYSEGEFTYRVEHRIIGKAI